MSDHVSDLRWDRWLAGELSADDRAAATAHADSCARCGERLRAITAARDAFRTPFPRRRARRPWMIGGGLVAAAAAVALVLRPGADPGERRKGSGPVLIVAGGPASALAPLSSGDRVRSGESLQVGYSSETRGFGAVISRDAAGVVSSYVPSQGGDLVALPAGENLSFPESTILDDTLGSETVFVVWCEAVQALAPFLAEARSGELGAHDGCHHRRLVLEKRR